MVKTILAVSSAFLSLFLGCARLEFEGKGLTYYDPKPYLLVSTTDKCVTTATVVLLPADKRTVKFKPGYGTADLSVSLNNGMISAVGQKTDTKIPETINAISNLGTAVSGGIRTLEKEKEEGCSPQAVLYPIKEGGEIDKDHSIEFKVGKK